MVNADAATGAQTLDDKGFQARLTLPENRHPDRCRISRHCEEQSDEAIHGY
jgi:hypothetical protein